MSELDDRFVYRGVWTNREYGRIMGHTITTDVETSIIIVALLAIMSTVGATHLWNLLLFVLHQHRATGNPQDALFRQQQTLLRTLPAPGSFFTEAVKLWWTWRRKQGRVFLRCLFPALISLVFAISTLSASVFSSAIVNSSDIQVLVNSPHCGFRNFTRYYLGPAPGERNYVSTYESIGQIYANQCYKGATSAQSGCKNVFTNPRIPFTIKDASCPFEDKMCIPKGSPAIEMDSGLLDLNENFGLNLEQDDGVKFRRKTTCSVLPTEGYVSLFNVSDLPKILADSYLSQPRITFLGEKVVLSKFGGPRYLKNGSAVVDESTGLQNVSTLKSEVYLKASNSYSATGLMTLANYDDLPFKKPHYTTKQVPLPEITPKDADLALIFIGFGLTQFAPVNDPLFKATTLFKDETMMVPIYVHDAPSGTLGCAVQYQTCITRPSQSDACTSLGPLSSDAWQTSFPDANSVQKLTLQILGHSSWGFDFGNFGKLNATYTANRGRAGGLPDDQWKNEAIDQESRVWSSLQIQLADYAIGAQATEPNAAKYVNTPTSKAEKLLCGSMRMKKSGGFANINVLGLVLILALSCFFIIADLVVLRSLLYIPRLRRHLAPRIDRWIQDGVLQLQRRAYESQMIGTWKNLEMPIPTTATLEKLPELPLSSRPRFAEDDLDLDLCWQRSRMGTSSTAATRVEVVDVDVSDIKGLKK